MFRSLARRHMTLPYIILPLILVKAPASGDDLPPAARWVPEDAVIVLEMPRPDAFLDRVLSPEVLAAITSLPAYQKQTENPGFKQFTGFVQYLEGQLGADWKAGLRKLLGGGITFAARPDGSTLLIVDAHEGRMLKRLEEVFLGFARSEAAKRGQPDPVSSREYRGVTAWNLGPEESHAILGDRLVLSNRPQGLDAALDLRSEPDGKSLASLPAFRAAGSAVGDAATVRAFVNMRILKQHPPVAQALTQARNPLASLIFAGVIESLQGSSWLAMGLCLEGETVTLKAVTDVEAAGGSGPARFASPGRPDVGALSNLSIPRRIAAMSLYRDLHGFYAAKDELFPERTSGLIFFENMMGIFFSGLDLTEEVLGETAPEIRFVVAEQEYDPAVGTPQVQLPAFAAVLRLRRPREFGEVVEEAWQKALGLINFTRGQQALPGLIIDRRTHGDTKYTVAYFRPPKTKEKTHLETRYNVRPALVMVDDWLIFSSTEGIATDLIDALKRDPGAPGKPTTAPLGKTHSLLEIDGAQLVSILKANRENLIRNNMIEKGNTKEQSENDIGLLLGVLEFLDRASIRLGLEDGRPLASLELKVKHPSQERSKVLRREGGGAPAGVAASHGRRSGHGR